jgi:hypothetical protein
MLTFEGEKIMGAAAIAQVPLVSRSQKSLLRSQLPSTAPSHPSSLPLHRSPFTASPLPLLPILSSLPCSNPRGLTLFLRTSFLSVSLPPARLPPPAPCLSPLNYRSWWGCRFKQLSTRW